VTKTDGLTYRVREILEGTFKRTFPLPGPNGAASPNGAVSTAEATDRAAAQVPAGRDRAEDNTPDQPGSEAIIAASGTNETRETEKQK
jgi:hypothetical protein